MRTEYTIEADLEQNIVITQRTVLTLEEFLVQARDVHAFALRMRGYPQTSAVPLPLPTAEEG